MGPGGTLGRSQNTTSTPLATSDLNRSTFRVSLSSFANTRLARYGFRMGECRCQLGPVAGRLPLSVSTYSAWASMPKPLLPCLRNAK
jgi:hypothetical protein